MEIAFGLIVLVLIVVGLRNRKKAQKAWVKTERFEESGDWIDKRSGERGTYGSLDDEMEANRQYIAKQGKVNELAQQIQHYCFGQVPDFQALDTEQLKLHLSCCKSELTWLFEWVENSTSGHRTASAASKSSDAQHLAALKKIILDFAFERFPSLLDQEIEQIKIFDAHAGRVADNVLAEISRLKA